MPRCRVSRYPNNLPRYSPDDGAGGGYRDIWFKLSRTAGWNGRAEEAGHSPRQSENKLHTYLPRVSRQWCTHAKLSLEVLEKLGKYEGRRKTRFLKKKKKKKRNDGDENRWERVDYSIFLFFFLCIRGGSVRFEILEGEEKLLGKSWRLESVGE